MRDKAIELIHIQQVLDSSIAVADLNNELNFQSAIYDLNTATSAAQALLESINALLLRCPFDFSLMKSIPVSKIICSNNRNMTLLDLGGQDWQDLFMESTTARG